MVFMDLPLTQEFKTLGMDNYLWVQALFNHEELERLRGQELNHPHQNASAQGSEYVAPPIENPIPTPIPAPCHPCGLSTALLALEEITEEPTFICEDLDGLLREADERRVRDLQEGSSDSVVCLPPRVGSEAWRRLNGIHQNCPGPGRRAQ